MEVLILRLIKVKLEFVLQLRGKVNRINYYNEIKSKLIDNEVYKRVKDYYKNKNELSTYYEVGGLLFEAGKKYGEKIINNYSKKLTSEIGADMEFQI